MYKEIYLATDKKKCRMSGMHGESGIAVPDSCKCQSMQEKLPVAASLYKGTVKVLNSNEYRGK